MFLTKISVRHPVFATMVMVALLVFGIYSYSRLPIEQMPNIDLPVVAVVVSYPGASAQSVENDVIKPIEDAVNSISGIDTLQSIAQQNAAMIIMLFDMDVKSTDAVQEVRDKVSAIEANLPSNADKPQILRFDPNALPILSLAIKSDSLSARTDTADRRRCHRPVAQHSGCRQRRSRRRCAGADRRACRSRPPRRLRCQHGGSHERHRPEQCRPAGRHDHRGRRNPRHQVEGRLEDVEDFRNIIVSRTGGQAVRLGDVATITQGQGDEESLAFVNGQRALAINIIKVQGANTVGVAEAVLHELDVLGNATCRTASASRSSPTMPSRWSNRSTLCRT